MIIKEVDGTFVIATDPQRDVLDVSGIDGLTVGEAAIRILMVASTVLYDGDLRSEAVAAGRLPDCLRGIGELLQVFNNADPELRVRVSKEQLT